MTTGNFERDVPESRQSDILQAICEAAWGEKVDGVSIIDTEQINVTNIEASGTILIDGVERWFHIRDGDRNGTELLGWEAGQGIQREPRAVMVLAPFRYRVDEAIHQGRPAELLARWDADLDPGTSGSPGLSQLPASAAYDAYFAPGSGAAQSHHEAAHRAGYEIIEEDDAVGRRRALLSAIITFAPIAETVIESRGASKERIGEILSDWVEAEDRQTGTGARVHACRQAVIDRLARIDRDGRLPTLEERRKITALGYNYCDVGSARVQLERLIRPLLTLKPIDGFDASTLPANPVAELFQRLDPALVSDTRIDPDAAGRRILDGLAARMARDGVREIPDYANAMAREIGFEIEYHLTDQAATEPEADISP